MFERFTDRARRVVVLAQEEARILHHNYIGTEHILLGLLREGEGVAAKTLEQLNIGLPVVRDKVEGIIGQGQEAPAGHIPFTPRAKKVLELSLREALQLGCDYIGTEHVLLGLIREGEGIAAQVLIELGADLSRVRQQVIEMLYGLTGQYGISMPYGPTGPGDPQPPSMFGRRSRPRMRRDVLTRIESLDRRLAALERWVGLGPDVDDLDRELTGLLRDKEAAIDAQDFETAAALRDREKELRAVRKQREQQWEQSGGGRPSLAELCVRLATELEQLQRLLGAQGGPAAERDPGQAAIRTSTPADSTAQPSEGQPAGPTAQPAQPAGKTDQPPGDAGQPQGPPDGPPDRPPAGESAA